MSIQMDFVNSKKEGLYRSTAINYVIARMLTGVAKDHEEDVFGHDLTVDQAMLNRFHQNVDKLITFLGYPRTNQTQVIDIQNILETEDELRRSNELDSDQMESLLYDVDQLLRTLELNDIINFG